MTFENLRQELDELTKIENPTERLLGILRFMALCSGLQAAGIVNVARGAEGSDAERLVTEMNELANACLPLAARALDEVVRAVGYGRTGG
jgi:hypothetical protein